ncbi:uncharacterized protein BXZ73DRAFT_79067 [Epithele typhae]|uniref:uncharacterized protein n=1 Tax=Epithele typhae TaxID=378194 RepID=UPI00200769A1|nr:uncharacterized protein BXZ73DRAFT_79067 [Epithele typhae]KAH9925413.1 hypothetical protein BXZ73DRAFT_79067 [Epithele typhae]
MDKGKRKAEDNLDDEPRRQRFFTAGETRAESSTNVVRSTSSTIAETLEAELTTIGPPSSLPAQASQAPALESLVNEATQLARDARVQVNELKYTVRDCQKELLGHIQGPVRQVKDCYSSAAFYSVTSSSNRETRHSNRHPAMDKVDKMKERIVELEKFTDRMESFARVYKDMMSIQQRKPTKREKLMALIDEPYETFKSSHPDWAVNNANEITEKADITEAEVDALVNPLLQARIYLMDWFGVSPQARIIEELDLVPERFKTDVILKKFGDWTAAVNHKTAEKTNVAPVQHETPTRTNRPSPPQTYFTALQIDNGTRIEDANPAIFGQHRGTAEDESKRGQEMNAERPTDCGADGLFLTDELFTPERASRSTHAPAATPHVNAPSLSSSVGVPTPSDRSGDVSFAGANHPGYNEDKFARLVTSKKSRRHVGIPDFAVTLQHEDGGILDVALIVEDKVKRNPYNQMKRYGKILGRKFGSVDVIGIRVTPGGKGLQVKWARQHWGRTLLDDDPEELEVLYDEGDSESGPHQGWYPFMSDFCQRRFFESRNKFLRKVLKLIEDKERMPL